MMTGRVAEPSCTVVYGTPSASISDSIASTHGELSSNNKTRRSTREVVVAAEDEPALKVVTPPMSRVIASAQRRSTLGDAGVENGLTDRRSEPRMVEDPHFRGIGRRARPVG